MELRSNFSSPIMGRCPFCGGNILVDRCIHCGRSNDLQYELDVIDFLDKYEKGILEPESKEKGPVHNYGKARDLRDADPDIWKLKTSVIAEIFRCSVSWVSHLKPKEYKQKYVKRDERYSNGKEEF
jgi:hypothetical protein